MARDPRVGWGVYYRNVKQSDKYLHHLYHYFYHGVSLCNRAINRMPDQILYEELPDAYKEDSYCVLCSQRKLQGWVPPKYLWRDDVYETYRGMRYETRKTNPGPEGVVGDIGQYDEYQVSEIGDHNLPPREDPDKVIQTVLNRIGKVEQEIDNLWGRLRDVEERIHFNAKRAKQKELRDKANKET